MSPRARFLLPGLLLAATTAAQGESGGFFTGIPAALSLESGAGVAGDTMHHKDHGFLQAAPPAWPSGGTVVDLGAILRSHGGQGLDVDALSIGTDWILADNNNGRIAFPPGPPRWAAITFSTTRGSQGAPGTRIRAESSGNGAGSDVFSWVLPGSAVPAPLIDNVERTHDSTEIDLSTMPNADLDALDHHLPMFQLDPGMQAMLPNPPTIFFSVSDATKNLVPNTPNNDWWNGTPPSGATILQTTLEPTGRWGRPRPFLTFRDLTLLAPGEDLDALAVDLPNQRLLFSTKSATLDEIQFFYFGTDMGNPMPYEDQNGTPVSTSIGLLQGDGVDAICAMDPSLRPPGGPGSNAYHFFVGTPQPGLPRQGLLAQVLEPTTTLHASTFRNYDPGAPPEIMIDTWMVGWPASGQGGIAILVLSFGNSLNLDLVLKIAVRNHPNPPFAGDPQHGCVKVPVAWTLMGHEITLRWFAIGANGGRVAEAWPILTEI